MTRHRQQASRNTEGRDSTLVIDRRVLVGLRRQVFDDPLPIETSSGSGRSSGRPSRSTLGASGGQ
jgi:hypothetical protein